MRHDLFVSFNLRTIEAACRNLHRAALTVHVHLHVPDPDDGVGRLLGVPKQRTDPFTQRKELKSTSIGWFGSPFRERECEKPDLGWTRRDGGGLTTRERKLVRQAKPSHSGASAEGGYSAIFREPEASKRKKIQKGDLRCF